MIFKPRGKSTKNCSRDAAKGSKNKKKRSKVEKAAEDPRIPSDEREAEQDTVTSRGEKADATSAVEEAAAEDDRKSEEKEEQHGDDTTMDGETEISKDDAEKTAGGGGATADGEEGSDTEGEKIVENGETSAAATVATVKTQSETKENEEEEEEKEEGGVAKTVVENGIGTDEEDEVESLEVVAMKKQQPEEVLE